MPGRIEVIGPRDPRVPGSLDVTSRSTDWARGLSPMLLGPVTLPSGEVSQTVENAWQFSKIFDGQMGSDGRPTAEWTEWARAGWARARGERFPRGRGARPVGSWDGTRLLGYLEARRHLYAPLYAAAVRASPLWPRLQRWHADSERPTLWDFDGGARGERSLLDVATDPTRPLGHGFVLAMLLHYDAEWGRLLEAWDRRLRRLRDGATASAPRRSGR